MIRKIKNLFVTLFLGLKSRNSFIQNFAIVSSGKVLTMLIGILATPIIARIYSPGAYGTFALYNSIVSILGVLISFKLSAAFMIIEDESEFVKVTRVNITLILLGTLFFSSLFFFFDRLMLSRFENNDLNGIWYLFGLGILFFAMRDFIGHWNAREKAFRISAKLSVSETIGIKGGTLGLGVASNGISTGLIIGELFGKALHIVLQFSLFIKEKWRYLLPILSYRAVLGVVNRYADYPLFIMPSVLVSQVSNSIFIFYLSFIYRPEYVGAYSMSVGLLAMPVVLVAYAAQPILTQKVAESSAQKIPIVNQLRKFVLITILFSSVPVFLLMLAGRTLILVFLGSQWELTSLLITWMSPLMLFEMLVIPLSGVLLGLKKNKSVFHVNIVKMGLTLLLLILLPSISVDFFSGIKIFIVVMLLINFFLVMYLAMKSGLEKIGELFIVLISFVGVVMVGYKIIQFF